MENRRPKIIIVDDVVTNLTIGRDMLRAFYEVYPAPSAEKMFAILEKVTPDLILLDIEMPEMDGYEAIGILKSDEKTRDIPVIFLTGNADEKSKEKGFSLGAAGYVIKPFDAPILLKCIENQLGAV